MRPNRWHLVTRLTILALTATLAAGCGLTRVCPTTIAQATSGDFTAVQPSTFLAVGSVIRYVPSPNAAARGYDLDVVRVLQGATPDGTMFLSVADPYPNIRDREAVLILGEPARGNVLVPGACPALLPLDDQELEQ